MVVAARNDDYGELFMDRFRVFLKSLSQQRQRFNFDFELVVVEWNPIANNARLKDAISWEDLCLNVRIITVPNEIHAKIENSNRIGLFEYTAKNVGIRRAKGTFVLATNPDIVFSNEMIAALAEGNFDHRCFYRAPRYDVSAPLSVVDSIDDRLRCCQENVCRVYAYKRGLFMDASGDFLLMSNDAWNSLCGYPEVSTSSHIDSYMLLRAQLMLRQVVLNEKIYHQEHDRTTLHSRPTTTWNPARHFPRLTTWGYSDKTFETFEVRV